MPRIRLPASRKHSSPWRPLVRAGAYAALAGSVAVPLLRRRWRIPAPVTVAATAAGPVALAVLKPRTKTRDAALYALQMWAFTMVHELPYDDPERLRERLHIDYPIRFDSAVGAGTLPTLHLQRRLAKPGGVTRLDKALTYIHWSWFFQPHLALTWILVRDMDRFPSSARQMAAVYDLGCLIYFLVPTAPPWWSMEQGHAPPEGRRLMVEVGEESLGRAWPVLYDSLNGNPWAAMPSLHFATSSMAAILLSESGPVRGAAGWSYALTLGFALVYLGEHYVVDVAAGAALVGTVRLLERYAEPVAAILSEGIQRLERVANG